MFQNMIAFVKQAIKSGELRLDEAERRLFDESLAANLRLLKAFAAGAGDGDHGETVEHEGQTLQRSGRKRAKSYRSISGVLHIERYVYAAGPKKKVAWAPAGTRLGRPDTRSELALPKAPAITS